MFNRRIIFAIVGLRITMTMMTTTTITANHLHFTMAEEGREGGREMGREESELKNWRLNE